MTVTIDLRFLLDTNTLSEPTKQAPHRGVVRKLKMHAGEVAIASTTWHELHFGLCRLPDGKRKEAIREYVFGLGVPILTYDDKAAEWHARERCRLAAIGYIAPFADGQIAAVAKVHGLTIVTNNVRDFSRFDGLTIENWRR